MAQTDELSLRQQSIVATGGEISNEWLEPVTDEQYPKD